MASNLSAQGGANAPPLPGQMDWSGLGALFGSGTAPGQAPRQGPVISPNPNINQGGLFKGQQLPPPKTH